MSRVIFESELFQAFASVLLQIRHQSFVGQVKGVGVLPVMAHDVMQAIDDVLVPHFDRQFAPATRSCRAPG